MHYQIQIQERFDAQHQVILPTGTEPFHSHQWCLNVIVTADELNHLGMVMDFYLLKKIVQQAITQLTGRAHINLHPFFQNRTASAENIAGYFFHQIAPELPAGAQLHTIALEEEPGCWAIVQK